MKIRIKIFIIFFLLAISFVMSVRSSYAYHENSYNESKSNAEIIQVYEAKMSIGKENDSKFHVTERFEQLEIKEHQDQLDKAESNYKKLSNKFISKERPTSTFNFSIKQSKGSISSAYQPGYHGRMYIPDAGVNHPLYRDGSQANVDAGNIGLMDWSGIIGVKGSVPLIGAHNNRGPFGRFGNLKIGSKIYIDTFYGQFIYQVVQTEITPQFNGGYFNVGGMLVNDYIGAGDKMILYTCYPFNYPRSDDRRFIVYAELIEGTILE